MNSNLFYGWVSPLFVTNRKEGTLQLADLFEIPSQLRSKTLTDQLEIEWFDEIEKNGQNANLFRATVRTMGNKLILLGLLLFIKELLNISQPILLILLMNFFEPCSKMPVWQAWLLSFGTIVIAFISSILFNQSYYHILTVALRMRLAYMGLVYRKVLRLSSYSMSKISSGEIMNILSNDASQIEMAIIFFNHLWLSPIEIILVIYLFWYFVKYVSFIAIGYAFLLLIVQIMFSRVFLHFRNKILKVTDERVKLMSEIIKSIRIIKMYCWETSVDGKIRNIRRREIIQNGFRLIFDSIQLVLTETYISVTFLMIYSAMWGLNIRFDIQFFAVASSLLSYMRTPIVEFFSIGIKAFVHYMAALKRIQRFLLLDEIQRNNRLSFETNTIPPRVICNLQQAKWEKEGSFSLDNIMFDAHPGDLICVIGPIGSGKSSLLQTLIGEIAFSSGTIQLSGSVCYVPQEPWIFCSSIKQNILVGKEYDQRLFEHVIEATALDSDFGHLSNREHTIVGDQGAMLSGGQKTRVNLARALYQNADIYLLDDPLSSVDVKVAKHLFEKSIRDFLGKKICILATHQIQFLQDATKIIVLCNGEVFNIGTYKDLLDSSPLFCHLLNYINEYEQKHVEVENSMEKETIDLTSKEKEKEAKDFSTLNNIEMKQKGILKWRVYFEYIRAGAGIVMGIFILAIVSSAQQGTFIFSSWWLATWNDEENYRHENFSHCSAVQINNKITSMTDEQWKIYRNQRFYIYVGIVLIFVLITLSRTFLTQFMFLNAARVLHNKMFKRILDAPIVFFDTNPIGRILNRFTKDISILDDSIPTDAIDFLDCCFQVLGVLFLVGWLHPWSIIPAIISAVGLFIVRSHFAPTSRDLKRLDGISRSPIYSHLSSTIDGLKVIRSSRSENYWSSNFLLNMDDNTRVNHLIIATNRWAAIRFDWIALVFIGLVSILAMVLRVTEYQHFSPSEIALVFSYSLSLMSLLQWTIRQSVVIETQMTSVERVLEYCSLDQEASHHVEHHLRPSDDWPLHGEIVFENVSMRHSPNINSPVNLRCISMLIRAREKIGIVGRTGAGKSSLIQSIFRMGTIVQGQIKIDNVDIQTIGLNDVRSRISIIPQDPVLFTGTIRTNLDPFRIYTDQQIWDSLEQVQLKTLVNDGMTNGLESLINENGSNLSVGQKQLLCLARVILKQNKIIVIDEATANVDNATDDLIQKTIRNKFRECTVLTIAHRLRTVIDSDRILVLENGELMEFDTPNALLSKSDSHLRLLVEHSAFFP